MNTIWVKSSLSFSNGNCVEVASLPGGEIGVRNSRDPGGPVLRFTPGEWDTFVGRARLGEFDRSGVHAAHRRRAGAGSPAFPAAIPGARADLA
jgi:Domain of unknown function (DUF397)